jgi:ATP:corrinoid adenosyltransferase
MKKYDQSVWFKEFSEETEEKKTKEDLLLDFDDFVSTKSPRKEEEKEDKKKKKKKKKSSIFEEIYVASFIILDEEWYALNATYFSFPKVLENTRKRVEELLENRFESFEDVVNYIKKK